MEKEVDSSKMQQVLNLLTEMRSYNSEMSKAALQTLVELDREAVVQVLTQVLNSQDSNLRCQAAETLVKLDPDYGVRQILPYLETPDSTLRWVICGLLSTHGDKKAVLPLVNVLQNDSEADVRMLAAFALGRIGDQRAISALEWAREHDEGTDYEGRRVSDVAADAILKIQAQYPQ
jgi:HEAT repeat protein